MCIICTRCVRACDSLRHTGAVTLSGKGHTTMIAFGTGGQVHESDCDFCGACIDVCPTATLMEKPNKWVGLATDWTNSVCNGCSVGCTISYGTADDRPVIVKPDRVNPASRDQICVRGRFGYVAVSDRERLTRSLVRAGDRLLPTTFDEAMQRAIESVEGVKRAHGANAVAVLGSPLALNEEAHLLASVAKAIGTPHLDFSHGPVHRVVSAALTAAFGTHRLPSSLTDLEASDAIIAVASDLEESHQVASLRIKDAVVKRHAQLVVISAHWGELESFAAAVLRVRPGQEAVVTNALAEAGAAPEGIDATQWANALAVLAKAQAAPATSTVVFAPNAIDATLQGETAKAAANLAIAIRNAEAASGLIVLPTDANVNGIADMGIAPGANGKSFPEIIAAAQAGEIKALIVHADNPLLNAPGTDTIRAALANLEALVVIDDVRSTTAEYATVVLAETPFHVEDGTIITADRHVLRQRPGGIPRGQERTGVAILATLAQGLGSTQRFANVAEVARDMHDHVAAFPAYSAIDAAPGATRALPSNATFTATRQPVAAPAAHNGLLLTTNRSLFTSWEGASIRSEEADQLHREEAAWVNPRDAEALGARNGETIALTDGTHEVRIALRLDDGVPAGTVYVPAYYDGGAIMALFPLDGTGAAQPLRLVALQPA